MTAAPTGERLDSARARWLLAVIFVTTILIGLNATMVSIALPRIVAELGASAEQGTWMLLAYLLVNGSMLIMAGQLADSWSPGQVFRTGLLIFLASSLALALIGGPGLFIAWRAVQGLAAAMLLSTAAAMIARAFPRDRMSAAMGIYFAGFAVAQVAGPSAGGVITAAWGWRWLFVVSAAIALIALIAGWRVVDAMGRSGQPRQGRLIDPWGNGIILVGLGALIFALSRGQHQGWMGSEVMGALLVALLAIPLFVLVERRVPNPAVRVDLLADRTFLLANVAGFLLVIPRMVPAVMLSLYYQGLRGSGPVEAAVVITPLAAGVAVGSVAAGRFGGRGEDGRVALAMNIATAGGIIVIAGALFEGGSPAWVGLGLGITGFTTGVFSTLNSTTILKTSLPERAGSTNGVRTMFQASGVSIGTALMLSIIVSGVTIDQSRAFYAGDAQAMTDETRSLLNTGYLRAFAVMLALVVGAAAAGAFLVRRTRAKN
ncbi:MAG: MFS transporter [Actinobacteria bacterium]|nr:MFS transporter [Actinomycetota bacterium]